MRLILATLIAAIMVLAGFLVVSFGMYGRHASSTGTHIEQGVGGCGGCL